MACQQVLETCELLENILQHLSFFDLLKARATAKSWKTLIDNSPTLQQQLFLRTDSRLPIDFDDARISSFWARYGNDLVSTNASKFSIVPLFARRRESTKNWTYTVYDDDIYADYGATSDFYLFHWDEFKADSSDNKAQHKALWRCMYATQPPSTAMTLYILGSRGVTGRDVGATVLDSGGVRLGLIADTYATMLRDLRKKSKFSHLWTDRPAQFGFRVRRAPAV